MPMAIFEAIYEHHNFKVQLLRLTFCGAAKELCA